MPANNVFRRNRAPRIDVERPPDRHRQCEEEKREAETENGENAPALISPNITRGKLRQSHNKPLVW